MQSDITFAMFGVRIAEIKVPWMENKRELLADLDTLQGKLAARVEQGSGEPIQLRRCYFPCHVRRVI